MVKAFVETGVEQHSSSSRPADSNRTSTPTTIAGVDPGATVDTDFPELAIGLRLILPLEGAGGFTVRIPVHPSQPEVEWIFETRGVPYSSTLRSPVCMATHCRVMLVPLGILG